MRRLALLSTLVLLGAPSAAQARPPLAASVGLADQVVTSRSFDFVSRFDHLPMVRFAAGSRVEIPRGMLDLDLAFRAGTTGAAAHVSDRTQLWLKGLELSATYRLGLYWYFEPYARLTAGYEWASLSVGGAGATLEQTVGDFTGTATLGVCLPVVAVKREGTRRTVLAFDLGLGYGLHPDFTFDRMLPTPTDKPQSDAPRQAPVNLGSLRMAGFLWQLGVTLRL